jgi:hypothetical protein
VGRVEFVVGDQAHERAEVSTPTAPSVEAFPEVMDVPTVCRFIGVHRNTLTELMHRGDDPIPFRRVGRRNGIRFLKRKVEDWLAGELDVSSQPMRLVK